MKETVLVCYNYLRKKINMQIKSFNFLITKNHWLGKYVYNKTNLGRTKV